MDKRQKKRRGFFRVTITSEGMDDPEVRDCVLKLMQALNRSEGLEDGISAPQLGTATSNMGMIHLDNRELVEFEGEKK